MSETNNSEFSTSAAPAEADQDEKPSPDSLNDEQLDAVSGAYGGGGGAGKVSMQDVSFVMTYR